MLAIYVHLFGNDLTKSIVFAPSNNSPNFLFVQVSIGLAIA